jgi:hypothetical protein
MYIIRKYKNSKYPQLKQEYKDSIDEYYSFVKDNDGFSLGFSSKMFTQLWT